MKYSLVDKLSDKIILKTDKYIDAVRMFFILNMNNDRQYIIKQV